MLPAVVGCLYQEKLLLFLKGVFPQNMNCEKIKLFLDVNNLYDFTQIKDFQYQYIIVSF